MRPEAPPQICVVKKEQKEAKLIDFLRRNLAASIRTQQAPITSLLMIARSIESPVARALMTFCAETQQLSYGVRAILTTEDGLLPMLLSGRGERLSTVHCRLASDVRLLDAHELLVLGPVTAWIGDCMRRDPSRHDAYEFYSEDAPEAARTASKSFERIWGSAMPLSVRGVPAATLPDVAAMTAEASASNAPAKTTEAATRH